MDTSSSKRVFISYRLEDHAFADRVLLLADNLRAAGVDVWIDRYVTPPPGDWALLLTREFLRAHILLVVCSDGYRKAFEEGVQPGGMGRGVAWEAALLRSELWREGGRARRCVPVLLAGYGRECIPRILDLANLHELSDEPSGGNGWTRLLETCGATGAPCRELPRAAPSAESKHVLSPLPATQLLVSIALPEPEALRVFLSEWLSDLEPPTVSSVDHVDRVFALVRALAAADPCRLFDALEAHLAGESSLLQALRSARASWGWSALPARERRWGALVGAFPGGLPEDVVPRSVADGSGRWGQIRLLDGVWSVDAASNPPSPAAADIAAVLSAVQKLPQLSESHREVEILALLQLGQTSQAWHAWDRFQTAGWPGSLQRMERLASAFFEGGVPEKPRPGLEPSCVQRVLTVLHASKLQLGDVRGADAAIRSLWGRRTRDSGGVAELWARMCLTLGDFSAVTRHLDDADREAPALRKGWLRGLRGRLAWLSSGEASIGDFAAVETMPVRQQVLLGLWAHEIQVSLGRSPPDLSMIRQRAAAAPPGDLFALYLLELAREVARREEWDRADVLLCEAADTAAMLGIVPLALDVEIGRFGVAARRGRAADYAVPDWIAPCLTNFRHHARTLTAGASPPRGW